MPSRSVTTWRQLASSADQPARGSFRPMDGTPNLADSSQAIASQDVADRLPKHVSLPLFEAALLRLGCAGTHGEVTALFNGAANFNQIRDWRRGRSRVPQWAWDYLGVLLDQKIAADSAVRASVRNPPNVSRGQGSARNIAKWNARRAALKNNPK